MKIGVIGGGQLGRMLALAGTPLGMNFAFLDPAPDACAAALGEHLRADYSDPDHLRQLADEVDLVTFEFESVPAETVAFLSQFVPVYPSAEALRIARDRWFRSEEHTSELQSRVLISYAVFCLKKSFFNDTATTEIYTLSLHDALPIWSTILHPVG